MMKNQFIFFILLIIQKYHFTGNENEEVQVDHKITLSSNTMTNEELENYMNNIIQNISMNKENLNGDNFSQKLANFLDHDLSKLYNKKNNFSNLKDKIKEFLKKYNKELLDRNTGEFLKEVLPIIKEYYLQEILEKDNIDVYYNFSVIIKQIKDTILIQKNEKNAQLLALFKSFKEYLQSFLDIANKLTSINDEDSLFENITSVGARSFINSFHLDIITDDDIENTTEILRGFFNISFMKFKNDEEASKPKKYKLIYWIMEKVKIEILKDTLTDQQIKLVLSLIKQTSKSLFSNLTEKNASKIIISLLEHFYKYQLDGSSSYNKYVRYMPLINTLYKKDGIMPSDKSNGMLQYYWADLFLESTKVQKLIVEKEEIIKLIDNIEIILRTPAYKFSLRKYKPRIFIIDILDMEDDNILYLMEFYKFFQKFLTEKISQIIGESELYNELEKYLLEIRKSEHPELIGENDIMIGNSSNKNMIVGERYFFFKLCNLYSNFNSNDEIKFPKPFSEEEIKYVVKIVLLEDWIEFRELIVDVLIQKLNRNFEFTEENLEQKIPGILLNYSGLNIEFKEYSEFVENTSVTMSNANLNYD